MIKKILYVGSKYEYGLPKNGPSLNKLAFFNNFKHLHYDIAPIWYDEPLEDLQQQILVTARTFRPDIIFFILQSHQISFKTLSILRSEGFFLVNWFGDDQWRFNDFTSKYAKHFNVCITTDKFSIDRYHALGAQHVYRSQWGSLSSEKEYTQVTYRYDVSFIGACSPYRKWFSRKLALRGINISCFGSGWTNGRVSYKEAEDIILHSKINLNVSNSTQYDIRYLFSSPRNLINFFRNIKNSSQTKARIFEIPVQGGFELTEYVPSLEDYFHIGHELACYTSIDEAALLINYFLKHEEERERIKLNGVIKARQMHTYLNRIQEFMRFIEGVYGSSK